MARAGLSRFVPGLPPSAVSNDRAAAKHNTKRDTGAANNVCPAVVKKRKVVPNQLDDITALLVLAGLASKTPEHMAQDEPTHSHRPSGLTQLAPPVPILSPAPVSGYYRDPTGSAPRPALQDRAPLSYSMAPVAEAVEPQAQAGKRPHKNNKLLQMNRSMTMTGILYALCRSEHMSCINEIKAESLRQLGYTHKESEARFGILVEFGSKGRSELTKAQLSRAISAVLNVLDGGVGRCQPLKWDTLQRHMLWKYQRRFQSDSLYFFDERNYHGSSDGITDRKKIISYGEKLVARLEPLGRTVDEILQSEIGTHHLSHGRSATAAHAAAARFAPRLQSAASAEQLLASKLGPQVKPELPAATLMNDTPMFLASCTTLVPPSGVVAAAAADSPEDVILDVPCREMVSDHAVADHAEMAAIAAVRPDSNRTDLATMRAKGVAAHQRAPDQLDASGGVARPFRCPVVGCNYSAPYRRYLSAHMRYHLGHKPFICDYKGCKYACSTSSHLARHKRVHTKEKPFRCHFPGCQYAGTQSGHLAAHQRTHRSSQGWCGSDDATL
eukprot:SAG11_NODE_1739_length_4338_cov_2.727294_2_plen_555_part_00